MRGAGNPAAAAAAAAGGVGALRVPPSARAAAEIGTMEAAGNVSGVRLQSLSPLRSSKRAAASAPAPALRQQQQQQEVQMPRFLKKLSDAKTKVGIISRK
jgi:hypothetical protein